MNKLPNFSILNRGRISFEFLSKGLRDFHGAIDYVKDIPYGRTSRKNRLELVLIEHKGTCSTKHAILTELARENGHPDIQLMMGIYNMNGQNTFGVGKVLDEYGLEHLPEAHNYISYNQERFDFTRSINSDLSPFDSLVEETAIQPDQIGEYKHEYHRNYIKTWLKQTKLRGRWNVDKIWRVREDCIRELSGIKKTVIWRD